MPKKNRNSRTDSWKKTKGERRKGTESRDKRCPRSVDGEGYLVARSDGFTVAFATVAGYDPDTGTAASTCVTGLDGTLHEWADMEPPLGWFVTRTQLDTMVRAGRIDSDEVAMVQVPLLLEQGRLHWRTTTMATEAPPERATNADADGAEVEPEEEEPEEEGPLATTTAPDPPPPPTALLL